MPALHLVPSDSDKTIVFDLDAEQSELITHTASLAERALGLVDEEGLDEMEAMIGQVNLHLARCRQGLSA